MHDNRHMIVDELKAKAYLAEYALRRPSLHWWITADHQQAVQAYAKLKTDFQTIIQSTNELQLRLQLYNDTDLACFDLERVEQHRGEAPATIVFDHVTIPSDTWIRFFTLVRDFGTLNTFFIGSNVK